VGCVSVLQTQARIASRFLLFFCIAIASAPK